LALSGPGHRIERQISSRLIRIRLVMNTLPSAVTGKTHLSLGSNPCQVIIRRR